MTATSPAQSVAAVESMASIEALMDRWYKGQSTPVDVLMLIAQVVGGYQMSKP